MTISSVRHVCLHHQARKTGSYVYVTLNEKNPKLPLSSRDEKATMAAAHTAGTDGITKVLESICLERRRENRDKESEGNSNAYR